MRTLGQRHSIARRIAGVAGISAVAMIGVVVPAVAQPPAEHAQSGARGHAATIDTYASWDGKSSTSGFGCGGGTDLGQVVTVPEGKTTIDKYDFWVLYGGQSGSLVLRTEIYAWDGSKASGPALYESRPQTIDYTDDKYHKLSYKPAGVQVTAGQQYLIFGTIDKDYEQCDGVYGLRWASVTGDVYPGGQSEYQRDFGDESEWTLMKWRRPHNDDNDLTFRAYLS